MKNSILEAPSRKVVQPVEIPTTGRALKNKIISIRLSEAVSQFIERELAKMGIASARDRQDFYRGAILAGITNARRAKSPEWKKFVEAIQPLARKHLGVGLDLNDAREIMESGADS